MIMVGARSLQDTDWPTCGVIAPIF
ncbi:hypothetical protein SPV1_09263 [Mariprofundus ferrooxydans PV-1]|uniref:Uncharacterized protein n=1 Tax=Mariprofundus ferrooxydans PV-1 TaxID=314345 RepID=Q0F012_9PROT|nr:hypothetical protein SPV1_09263 [Mariprofundus ferrooxydans PV-1]